MNTPMVDLLVGFIQENEIEPNDVLSAAAQFMEGQAENAAVNHADSRRSDIFSDVAQGLRVSAWRVTGPDSVDKFLAGRKQA